jgi:hypothetical protein
VEGCCGIAARAGCWCWGLRGRDCGDRLLDPGGELVDLAAEGVDLVQQHPRQLCMMVVEAAGEGLHQGGVLDAQPPSGQPGQHLGVALASDQRLQHGPAGDAEDVGGHRPKLDQGVLQQLLQPLLVAGALLGQVGAQPGVVPQPADLGGGTNEGRSMPRSFSLHNHTASSLSVLGRPGRCLTWWALTSHTRSPRPSSTCQ